MSPIFAIFAGTTVVAWLTVVGFAAKMRGGFYPRFAGIVLGVHSLVALGLASYFAPVWPLFLFLHLTVYVHFAF